MERTRTHYSFYSKDLTASVNVPADWDTVSSEDFPLALLAPLKDGFRTNVGFNLYKLSGGDEQKFQKAIQSSKQVLVEDYDQYKMISEQEVWIDGFPSYHQEYTWLDEETGHAFYQTMTLIYVLPERLYEVTGTSLLKHKDENSESLRDVISSFRFINLGD